MAWRYGRPDDIIPNSARSHPYGESEACYPAYRCELCNTIEGSVGMPERCRTPKEEVNPHG